MNLSAKPSLRPQTKNERVFKKGSIVFIEGETSREMFIIQYGKIRILKQEGDRTIELVTLGPGSVLGEMSLLDNAARSATAQVMDETKATVIDESVLDGTLEKIPSWLVSVIKIVVKRLRETNNRLGVDIAKNNLGSIANIIYLMVNKETQKRDGQIILELEKIQSAAFGMIGIGASDVERILSVLVLKNLMILDRDITGQEQVVIRDLNALKLFVEFSRRRDEGKKMDGEDLSLPAQQFLEELLECGTKQGRKDGNLVRVAFSSLHIELQKKGKEVNLDSLDELSTVQLVTLNPPKTADKAYAYNKCTMSFDPVKFQKAMFLKNYLPYFIEDIIL